MKKILVLSMLMFVASCACMNSDEEVEEIVYKTAPTTTYTNSARNCDFIENGICYHYVYDTNYAPTTYRYYTPERYQVQRQEVKTYRQESPCAARRAAVVEDNGCKTTVRETREPVEVVYKKTRYTTVYEPKTYEEVSYEKEAYTGYKKAGCADCL